MRASGVEQRHEPTAVAAVKRSGLKPASPEQIRAWNEKPRKPLARSRLKQGKGAKARREEPALDAFRAALIERSGGECESPYAVACGTSARHRGDHCHHVEPNDRDRGVHDPDRGLYLCARSHAWAHAHPVTAAVLGLLRPTL